MHSAGSASRVVCVRCVRLRQHYPLSSVGLVKGDPRCRCNNASQVTLPAGFCVEEGLRGRATTQTKALPWYLCPCWQSCGCLVLAAGMDVTLVLLAWGFIHWHPLKSVSQGFLVRHDRDDGDLLFSGSYAMIPFWVRVLLYLGFEQAGNKKCSETLPPVLPSLLQSQALNQEISSLQLCSRGRSCGRLLLYALQAFKGLYLVCYQADLLAHLILICLSGLSQ